MCVSVCVWCEVIDIVLSGTSGTRSSRTAPNLLEWPLERRTASASPAGRNH